MSTSSKRTPRARISFASEDPLEIVRLNAIVAPPFQVEKHKREAARNWDLFYRNHGDTFFRERHWTDREFELSILQEEARDLVEGAAGGGGKGKGKGKVVLEVGCGTGAFVYPLLKLYPSARFHAFDFSKRAIDLVKKHELYTPSRVHAFVHDLTAPTSLAARLAAAPPEFWAFPSSSSPLPTAAASKSDIAPDFNANTDAGTTHVDLISCVFVLSALPPGAHASAVRALVDVLKPGGTLILRDYALHDQAQLRFHALPSQGYAQVPSLLSAPLPQPSASSSNSSSSAPADVAGSDAAADAVRDAETGRPWYRRGDSTLTYFFTPEEVDGLVHGACEASNKEGNASGGGARYEMRGEAEVIEREMENRAEKWGCRRRFVQGRWKKVLV